MLVNVFGNWPRRKMGQYPSHSAQSHATAGPTVAIVGELHASGDVRPILDGTAISTRKFASQLRWHEGPVVLSFLSPSCGLCASVKRELQARAEGWQCRGLRSLESRTRGLGAGTKEVEGKRVQELYLCLDASDTALWGPEIVHYGIESVPCFVVLGAKGSSGEGRRVVGKTTCVRGESCVLEGLDRLLQRVS